MANNKPIPSGLPTAAMHFGPMHGGLLTQAIRLNDEKLATGSIACWNAVFGDRTPNVVKSCSFANTSYVSACLASIAYLFKRRKQIGFTA